MLQYFRFILYVITGFFLFIFVYITFYSDQYRGHKNYVPSVSLGQYILKYDDKNTEVLKKKIATKDDISDIDNAQIFWDNQTLLDNFYMQARSAAKYSKKYKSWKAEIQVWDGEYYFSFRDPKNENIIYGENFKIEVLSPWNLYIRDTTDSLWFYSAIGIYKIFIKDQLTENYINSFYIFPWMYAKWTKYAESSVDSGYDKIVNELFYINNLQLTTKSYNDPKWPKQLLHSFKFLYLPYSLYGDSWINTEFRKIFWSESFNFLDIVISQEQEVTEDFKNQYRHFEYFSDYDSHIFWNISKYFYVFFNDSKKVVYYKNQILSNLSNIVQDKWKYWKLSKIHDNSRQVYVEKLAKNMDTLRNISDVDYKKMESFIRDFYYFYTYLYPTSFSVKQDIEKIYTKENATLSSARQNDMYIAHVFQLFHTKEISYKQLSRGLISYINASSSIIDTQSERAFYYYYYSYNKILKNHIRSLWLERAWFDDIKAILENISFINDWFFTNKNVEKWMLYINAEIIENILLYLETLYFEDERNENNLLILKDTEINVNDELVLQLQENIQSFFEYFKKTKILDNTKENDIALIEKYERFDWQSDEYFEAIISNDDYINAKALWALEKYSTFAKETQDRLSKEKLVKYLEWFNKIDPKNADIKVVWEEYYEIRMLSVGDELLSFDLYPLEFHKLTNIKKSIGNKEYLSDILLTDSENSFILWEWEELSVDVLYDYLIDLWNIELNKEDIEVVKGTYFTLKNINVEGTKYDFSFFPRRNNAVTEVMEWLGVIYRLDNLKPNIDTLNVDEKQEQYENFFVEIISKAKIAERELVVEKIRDKDTVEADLFKNEFLFWKWKDFTNIVDKINLEYSNVNVVFEDGEYFTSFKEIDMFARIDIPKNERGEVMKAKISAEYVKEIADSYFKNLELQFYFYRKDADERYDFYGESLDVTGLVSIGEFDEFYDALWETYISASKFHELQARVLSSSKITKLTYDPKDTQLMIHYEFLWNTINTVFQKSEITELIINWESSSVETIVDIETSLREIL